MAKTFRGGVHPPELKFTSDKEIVTIKPPQKVIIPLSQHTGAPAKPIVKVGDEVLVGAKIGEADGFISVPVHSSVSGKIIGIGNYPHPFGRDLTAIEIENDGKDEWIDLSSWVDLEDASPDEMRKAIREAGIVGLGGAAFPTHVKLSPPEGRRIDTVIINGAECEPFLTSDHRLMLERSNEIVAGLRIMMRILGASQGLIAIERNKPDAIEKMKQEVKGEDSIRVIDLKVKYPQGAEKQLIHAVTGREVPCGGLPMDVGCLVQNVGTSCAVYQAIKFGRPLVERVLTVSGSAIKNPGNYFVRIGSRFCDVINEAGGVIEDPGKVIMGGPMMGIAQHRDDVPVIKGTSGIIVLRQRDVSAYVSQACIRCGRCVTHCPMWLMPNEIARSVEKGLIQRANIFGLMDCMECGVCAYVCPSKINHVHLVKLGKAEVFAMRKRGVEVS